MTAPLEALRGQSPRIEAIRKQVTQLLARQTGARRLPPVLILGETGTGKGLLAHTIHQAGPRREGPFVDINCAAIPETLLEAELFGYERGAFTDARHAKPGLFQTAHGGTLFLDEIGLLPAALQAKLLTAIEDRAVRRLGSTRAEAVDVALMAATSVDLRRAVAEARFREDLYHRLAVITLELPPLRTRGPDVLALADHFLARAYADYGLSPRALTPEARDVLVAYHWPGNVRELANAMERVALLSDRDEITAATLDFLMPDETVEPVDADDSAETGSLEDTLRARIEAALRGNGGNIRRTAAALGISRNTLRARMDKYGLRHPEAGRPRRSRATREPVPAPAPAAPPQWDRRHLAFLRVRLPASSTVDVARTLEVVGDKVRTFGGRIEESSPTGVIAVFGLEPVDNAPSHAALAALAIQNAARARTGGADVVSAIHCADHLVDSHPATPVIGVDGKAATWSLLEALVAGDDAGATLVSGPVVPFLVRRFALEQVREDERNAWKVLRVEEVSASWSATRFVGRTSELTALRQAAELATQRRGQLGGLGGEAGVGKSRLVHEAVQPLQGWLLLASGGVPYMKGTSYYPLVELLRSLYLIQDMDAASAVRERVTRALPADVDPHAVRPPILDLLGVLPLDDAFRDVDPVQRRKRTHDAVRQVFLTASLAQPLCLIIEDLHWIDAETQAVLDSLVNSMTGARVLLLVNYRPEYQHPWGSKSCYSQVRLDALPAESAGELLDALLGYDPGLDPLKALLVKRGNPFFLEETVRMLVETDALAGERGRYRLAHPVHAIQVPPRSRRCWPLASIACRRRTATCCRSRPSSARTCRWRCSRPSPISATRLSAAGSTACRPPSSSTRRGCFPIWSTRSSTRSPTRWPTRGCSTTSGGPCTRASWPPSSGSAPIGSTSTWTRSPITRSGARSGTGRWIFSGARRRPSRASRTPTRRATTSRRWRPSAISPGTARGARRPSTCSSSWRAASTRPATSIAPWPRIGMPSDWRCPWATRTASPACAPGWRTCSAPRPTITGRSRRGSGRWPWPPAPAMSRFRSGPAWAWPANILPSATINAASSGPGPPWPRSRRRRPAPDSGTYRRR